MGNGTSIHFSQGHFKPGIAMSGPVSLFLKILFTLFSIFTVKVKIMRTKLKAGRRFEGAVREQSWGKVFLIESLFMPNPANTYLLGILDSSSLLPEATWTHNCATLKHWMAMPYSGTVLDSSHSPYCINFYNP